MITCNELSALNPPPHEPGRKLPVGPTDLRDPGGRDFVASWQAHVDAGRIGSPCRPSGSAGGCASQPLREAGDGLSDETRATILANERLICGRQRTIIG